MLAKEAMHRGLPLYHEASPRTVAQLQLATMQQPQPSRSCPAAEPTAAVASTTTKRREPVLVSGA